MGGAPDFLTISDSLDYDLPFKVWGYFNVGSLSGGWSRVTRGGAMTDWPVVTTACADCGVGTITLGEWYTVRDEILEQAWLGRRKS